MSRLIFISYLQTLNMLKQEKKSSSGTKRKASALMNKPNKDQESKQQKMTEVGPISLPSLKQSKSAMRNLD